MQFQNSALVSTLRSHTQHQITALNQSQRLIPEIIARRDWAPVRVKNARSGTGEEREEWGKRGGGTPLHAKTTVQIGITEHPRFFGMNISVMEVIQVEPV